MLAFGDIAIGTPFSFEFAILNNTDHVIEKDQFAPVTSHFA
jgi:hypothetical protein